MVSTSQWSTTQARQSRGAMSTRWGIAAAIGLALCFTCNALSFGAVLVSLAAMRGSELFPAKRVSKQKKQVRQGLRYVRNTPELFIPLLMIAVIGTLAWEFQVSLPLMASKVFHGGAAWSIMQDWSKSAKVHRGSCPTTMVYIVWEPTRSLKPSWPAACFIPARRSFSASHIAVGQS